MTKNRHSHRHKLKRVFIIHGRDLKTVRDLEKFLSSLGFTVLKFKDLANSATQKFVIDVVLEAITNATVVIAVFTPDELAVLYEGQAVSKERSGRRWQARPNVIFEAGIAYGISKEKTILVTAGADVELFSDLSGLHFIRLDSETGREDLRTRLNAVTGRKGNRKVRRSAKFLGHILRRWEFFDELDVLEKLFSKTIVPTKTKKRHWLPISMVLRRVVEENPNAEWNYYSAEDFMDLFDGIYPSSTAEYTFWYLYMWGFFQPNNIEQWVGEETVSGSVEFCELAPRGKAYLQKLQSQLPLCARV